jgi:hypothetical protein
VVKNTPADKGLAISQRGAPILYASRCFAWGKMAGQVDSKNFSGRFGALSGRAPLTATHADIIRSLLTVGYPSRRAAVRKVGVWRERMLVTMATGYLDDSLRTTRYFRNLEQTEKVGVSFLLGEAFTHWYAQTQMRIECLVHVAGLWTCEWVAPSVWVAPKQGATVPSPKSRPDFIGMTGRERHVFESKGRIRWPSKAVVGKALGQVSSIRSVNGKRPITRCATFFMLKASGAEGLVLDPPEHADGLGGVFDELEALEKAYSFFLEGPTDSLSDQIGEGYVGREIESRLLWRRRADPPRDSGAPHGRTCSPATCRRDFRYSFEPSSRLRKP